MSIPNSADADYRGRTFLWYDTGSETAMFHILHTFHPSPILATFGPFELHWYGLALASGAALGYAILDGLARHYGYDRDRLRTMFLLTVIIGFLGGRLYHVLNEPSYYLRHPEEVLAVWHGGLAIHGAILAGFLTIWIFCRRNKLAAWRMLDLAAPAVLIGQAVGRWGNYFNQELFGRATNLPWGIPIDPVNRPESASSSPYFHPTFLYESLWDLFAVVVLLLLHRRQLQKKVGTRSGIITMSYFVLYGIGRFGVELLRIDQVPIIAGIRLPLIVSALVVLCAVAGFWYRTRVAPTPLTENIADAHPQTN